jgi:signal transduction histidine kinase
MYQIAEKKKQQTEQALFAEQEAIKHSVNFVDMISHEYRTPLSVLNIGLDILAEKTSPELARMLTRMRASADRLLELFETSLDEKRIKDANMALIKKPVNLANVVSTVVEYSQLAYPDHVITFAKYSSPAVIVAIDVELLNIALSNILDNACKYSEPQQAVNVTLQEYGNNVCLRVEDYGLGINAAEITNIFEKYYRSESVGKKRGVGVGLFLVKKIVDLHQATIKVTSNVGEGTLVEIRLPRT